MKLNKIWLSWENHRRTRELAEIFKTKLFIVNSKLPLGIRYLINIINSIRVLLHEKPQVLFVQNPSLILATITGLIKPLFGYVLIVDRHTNFRIGKKNRSLNHYIFKVLSDLSLRMADLTIVTNYFLKEFVEKNDGKAFVLTDKIPEFNVKKKIKLLGKYNVLFICSFSDDEPIIDVINSATYLSDDNIFIYITGDNINNRNKIPSILPNNVIFTGYLSENDYVSMLYSSDLIIDLTSLEWCLVCGGYEAMAANKPFITSKTIALQDFYTEGTVFVEHNPKSISEAILTALKNYNNLQKEIKNLKIIKGYRWIKEFKKLNSLIEKKVLYVSEEVAPEI